MKNKGHSPTPWLIFPRMDKSFVRINASTGVSNERIIFLGFSLSQELHTIFQTRAVLRGEAYRIFPSREE